MKAEAEAVGSVRFLKACAVLALGMAVLPYVLWFCAPGAVAPMLGAVYEQGSPELRRWAVRRMGDLGPAAVDPLLLALDDSKRSVREAAKQALARMPAKAVGLRVIKALEREPRLDAFLRGLILERPAAFSEATLEAGQSPRLELRRRAFSLLFFLSGLSRGGLYRPLAADWSDSLSLWETDFGCFRSERFRALYRRGLGDEDLGIRLLAMLSLRAFPKERLSRLSKADAALILDQPSFPNRGVRLASWGALAFISPETLKTVIAEDPDGRGRRFLRFLTEGFAEEETIYVVRDADDFFPQNHGCYDSPFRSFEDQAALVALLPLHRPKVREELTGILEAFRRRDPRAWPRAVYFFRPLKIEPDGYVEALAAMRGVRYCPLEEEAVAVLKGASSAAGRRAFQVNKAEYDRSERNHATIYFDNDATVTFHGAYDSVETDDR